MPQTPLLTSPLTRRALFGRAAGAATTLVVSQTLMGCGTADAALATDPAPGSGACVLTAALTEGPFFIDEKLNRSDIRADPVTGILSTGIPLALTFNVSRSSANACTPLTGAYIDVWHCDAAGVYSDVSGGGSGAKFLRGYQITDASGVAIFTTVYPGWYSGRAVHTHFKLRLFAGTTKTYEFTSQFFFPESLTTTVHAQPPYSGRGNRNTRNETDGIYNGLTTAAKSALTLATVASSSGYTGTINLVVQVG